MGINPGTPENGAGSGVGEVGQAFSFINGANSWVEIPYATNLATLSFTYEAWIYPANSRSGQVFIYGQSYGRQFDLEPGGGLAIFITDVNGHFKGLYSYATIPLGTWSHVAATWDGTILKLYINGALNSQGTPGLSVIGDSLCPFSIGGAGSCSPGQYFPGLIDEMSVYDRALFAGEIQAIYNAGSAGKCTGTPSCVVCPATAVSWWPAEGNASDLLGPNAGTLQNGTAFATGMVGQSFALNGANHAMQIPYATNLISTNFSFEVWLYPSNQVSSQRFIFGQGYGRQLVVSPGTRGLKVSVYVTPNAYTWYHVDSSAEIPLGEWTHLVGTWGANYLTLYVNGAFDRQAAASVVPWDSGCAFAVGGNYNVCGYSGQYFPGRIDEVTLYGSALAPSDVAALYNAGSAGKCWPPPVIITQALNQTVTEGGSAIFGVVASGCPPLSYQWTRNGQDIAGATGLSWTADDLDFSGNGGVYAVRISGPCGTTTSASANLTVVPCDGATHPLAVTAWNMSCEDRFNFDVTNLTGSTLTGGRFELFVYYDNVNRSFYCNLQPWQASDTLPSGKDHVFSFCSSDHSITNYDCAIVYNAGGACAASPKFRIATQETLALLMKNTTLMPAREDECTGRTPPAYIAPQARPVCGGDVECACGDWPRELSTFLSGGGGSGIVDNFYKASEPPQYVSVGCPKSGFKNVYALKAWHGAWGPRASIWGPLSAADGYGDCQVPALPQNTPDTNKYLALNASAVVTNWEYSTQYNLDDPESASAESHCSVGQHTGKFSGDASRDGTRPDLIAKAVGLLQHALLNNGQGDSSALNVYLNSVGKATVFGDWPITNTYSGPGSAPTVTGSYEERGVEAYGWYKRKYRLQSYNRSGFRNRDWKLHRHRG